MRSLHRPSVRPIGAAPALAAVAFLVLAATPAGAQYGGGANLVVNPVEVEIDGAFDYLGDGCPAGSTVEITIDGFSEILDTTIAGDDSTYAGFGVGLPDGVIAGGDYRVEANCAGVTNFANITAVCNGGTFPVDGECPDGQTVGGEDPPATTTTTPQSGGSGDSDGSDDSGTTTGTDGDDPDSSPDLAVTGASFTELAVQTGATLVALGGVLVLVTRRRRDAMGPVRPARSYS